jgi:ATP-dependent RNA helicase RhlE
MSTFDQLGLSPEIVRAVREAGYDQPTPIQAQAIPHVLAGRDLLARAQTGTGKTAAFALPLLERLRPLANTSFSPARHPLRVLVLTPTRELAGQVSDSFARYGRHLPLRSTVVYGGVPMPPQTKALAAGVEIVVATPGRLMDHLGSRTLSLAQVEVLVLDEADRMLDMGFIDDVRRILAAMPGVRQRLLFSATFSPSIRRLADELLRAPATVDIEPKTTSAETVTQHVYLVDEGAKRSALLWLLRARPSDQALVFVRTKRAAARLADLLERDGVSAVAIHGDRTQREREQALADFKSGARRVMVATDVAGRGLDIDGLPLVVNFELPANAEDYVHRIGRTGRAGKPGMAVALASWGEEEYVRGVNRLLGYDLPVYGVPGLAPSARPAAQRPSAQGRRRPVVSRQS